jgi:hypothetical protein
VVPSQRHLRARPLLLLLAAALALPGLAAASGPLQTAVFDPDAFSSPQAATAFKLAHDAGTNFVRLDVRWKQIAPSGKTIPKGFDPANPADPKYLWAGLDNQVQLAQANQLQPVITVMDAPVWAQSTEKHQNSFAGFHVGAFKPNPAQLQTFAHTLATRYDGSYAGLPRVRYFELWNEPNLLHYLYPQFEAGKEYSPDMYRGMVNAFSAGIHSVKADNVVIAGALAPFNVHLPEGPLGISPLEFMRKMLCMSDDPDPKPTCDTKTYLDVWSHHPYTTGGPTHQATEKDDVSLGDLPEMRKLLEAAARAGHVVSNGPVGFWVTEFSWDTKPPDIHRSTLPVKLHARWTEEALYRMWRAGVSLVAWYQLQDRPFPRTAHQSGLFYLSGASLDNAQPKPSFRAFRFPFVAYRDKKGILVWGRTPFGKPGRVAVQQLVGRRWRTLAVLAANGDGIFTRRLHAPKAAARKKAKRRAGPVHAARYRDVVVSGAPSSYWPLDGRGRTTAPDRMGKNTGTYAGGVTQGVPGVVRGSTAIRLDGTSAQVRLGPVKTAHSVELWLKTRSDADQAAFSNRNTISQYIAMGTWGGLAHTFDGYHVYGTTPIANGKWHHVVYTYDPATATGKIYVDGRLEGTSTWMHSEGGAASAYLGYDATLKRFFKGDLDEVAIYPYALSAAQVRAHYLVSGRRLKPLVEPGELRAVDLTDKATSLPFSLHRPKDRYVLPFGAGSSGP